MSADEALEDRVDALERQLALLTAEVESQRRRAGAPLPTYPARGARVPSLAHLKSPAPVQSPDPAQAPPPLARPAARRKPLDLEELLGGRLLAIVGGVAVIIGVAFFVALAISQGWIDETARALLSACGSVALFAGGVWLYEHKGRSQAAVAMVGTGITAIFLTLSVATGSYGLVPAVVALPFALAIGAIATAVAVRWDSRTLAGLGVAGTVATPLLSTSFDTTSMCFLAVAAAATAGVLVWRRWPWLAVGVCALTLAQVALWVAGDPADAQLVSLLCVFAALNLALTLGYQLRDPAVGLKPWAVLLVVFGALVLGALGYYGLPHAPGHSAGAWWLAGLAAAHGIAAGTAVLLRRVSDEIALVLLGAAVALADVAFGSLGDGWVLAAGWAASSLGVAFVARRSAQQNADLVRLSVGGQLALAVGHVLLFDAPPNVLGTGQPVGAAAVTAIVAVLVGAFASARLIAKEGPWTRLVLDSLSIAALAYVTALCLDGTPLLLAWAASAAALAKAADTLKDRLAGLGAMTFLGLLVGHALVFDAPPASLVDGLGSPVAAALALVLVAGVAVVCSRVETLADPVRPVLLALAAVALLYLGSVLIVSVFQPATGGFEAGRGGRTREQGQALVSAFWGGCGITALWVGLRTDTRLVRIAGLSLLCLAAGKVFLYDLAALGSVYRVASFIVLGLVLLAAAFVHQRLGTKPTQPPARPAV